MKRNNKGGGALLLCSGLALTAPLALALGQKPVDDSALTAKGREVLVDVLANDTSMTAPQALLVRVQPAHGSAQVVGGKIRYVPAPGFTGRDRFAYFVKKGRNAGLAWVTVDVGEALVLSGKVTDGPIANATVQASVDGNHFTAQADADGNYSLEVIGLDDGMVTLGAQGTGAQSAANFLSVLGDFDRVLGEAGADGELTRDENNQVQVTNVSTAQAYLMQVANGGAPITDDVELVVARESLDNGQLLQSAAAIKLVVDGGYALPEGVPDTLALISNGEALAGFLTAVNEDDPDAVSDAINAIASDPDLTVPASAEDLLGTYTLAVDLGNPGTVNTGYIQGNRITLDADGGGSFVQAAPNANPALAWSFDPASNRAVAILEAPQVSAGYEVIDGLGQVLRYSRTSRYEIAKLFEGEGRDTLAVTSTQEYWYPDNPELAGGTWTGTSTNIGIRDGAGTIAFEASEIAGTTRSLWIAGTPFVNTNYTGAQLFSFTAGGNGQRADGQQVTWSVDALGRLLVAYPDGTQSAYARVSSDERGAEGLAAEWIAPGGERSAALAIAFTADGFQFTAAGAQAAWRSGQFVSRASYDPGNTDFYLVFGPGQAGWHVTYTETAAFPVALGWSVADGVVDATYYRDGNNQPVHACQPGVDGCYVWQIRRWNPVASDGARVYVIEEFLVDYEGDGSFQLITQRNNFYDAGQAPPFAVAPSPTTVKKVARAVRKTGR